jgi:hypothetical protein
VAFSWSLGGLPVTLSDEESVAFVRTFAFVADGATTRSSVPIGVRRTVPQVRFEHFPDIRVGKSSSPHPGRYWGGGFSDVVNSWEPIPLLPLARARPNPLIWLPPVLSFSTSAPSLGHRFLIAPLPYSRSARKRHAAPACHDSDWPAGHDPNQSGRSVSSSSPRPLLPYRCLPTVTRPHPPSHVASHTFDWLARRALNLGTDPPRSRHRYSYFPNGILFPSRVVSLPVSTPPFITRILITWLSR